MFHNRTEAAKAAFVVAISVTLVYVILHGATTVKTEAARVVAIQVKSQTELACRAYQMFLSRDPRDQIEAMDERCK